VTKYLRKPAFKRERLISANSFIGFSAWPLDFIAFGPVMRQYFLVGVHG
jgi:hypothetical protein